MHRTSEQKKLDIGNARFEDLGLERGIIRGQVIMGEASTNYRRNE